MNGQINQLVKSLLQKESLEQCSLQELQQFADRHPYFGAAQLLLTKKLQVERPELYNEQLQKTYLFFHNPLWVQQLLDDTGVADITVAEALVKTDQTIFPVAMPEPGDIPEIIVTTTTEPEVTAQVQTEPELAIEPKARETEPELPIESKAKEIEPEPQKTTPTDLIFEPYHMVDYFASQGIRYKEEEKPVDKFGQQLRSFTDWLKTLKKLPLSEISEKVEPVSEKKVEQLAEHSLEEKDVVTETMAEVWEKQGNHLKAIEVYNKLSLLDPSKSAYFAAKIEELKKLI